MFKIALTAGHYRYTAGKRCLKKLDKNETREWVLNDRICDKIEKLLSAYEGYSLIRTDDTTGEKKIEVKDRVKKANDFKADFYLSIHHNAGVLGGKGGGIVAYTCKNCQAASTEWQKDLYNALIKETGLKGNRATPLASSNLYEVKKTKMPAVLLELGFMDSAADVPVILTEQYADACAKAIVEIIAKKAELKKKAEPVKNSEEVKTVTITLPVLKKGAKGPEVGTVQRILRSLGYKDKDGKLIEIDNSFGGKTEYAVEQFQKDESIEADKSVGKITWSHLLGVK